MCLRTGFMTTQYLHAFSILSKMMVEKARVLIQYSVMPSDSKPKDSFGPKLAALSVHTFTALGSVIGLLAFAAAGKGEWSTVYLLMLITLLVDSADGTLARKFRIKEVLPQIDGSLMDNLVDFVNYSLLPSFVLLTSHLLPEQFRLIGAAMVLISSCFQFSHTNAKTPDHFFRGFPSYWNILVIYLALLEASPRISLAAVIICTVLTFVPIYYVYPSRTPFLKNLTLWLSLPWIIMMFAAVMIPSSLSYPVSADMIAFYSLYYIIYYMALSLFLTFRRISCGQHSEKHPG